MKTIRENFLHWDLICFSSIFQLNGRELLSRWVVRLSHSGDGYLYPVIGLLVLIFKPSHGAVFWATTALAFAIELPFYKILKNAIRRERPCNILGGVECKIQSSDRFSFPSGHTAGAFIMATMACYFFPVFAPLMFLWALAIGFSRIFLGVHYPTDILAGSLLGVLSAVASIRILT